MLTAKELFINLRDSLKALTWPTSGSRVFGDSVYIVPEFPAGNMNKLRVPSLLIMDAGVVSVVEAPRLAYQNINIYTFVDVIQDPLGSGGIIGACHQANQSLGVGSKELMDLLVKFFETTSQLGSEKVCFIIKSVNAGKTAKGNFSALLVFLSVSVLVSNY